MRRLRQAAICAAIMLAANLAFYLLTILFAMATGFRP